MRGLRVLALATVALQAGATSPQQDDLETAIRAKLTEVREIAGFPGVTAAVAMPDGQVLVAAAGFADSTKLVPLTAATRMPAGSVGKTFVAAAILQAVDGGVLDLDKPIGQWVGGQAWFARVPNAGTLTLRLLLSHRSGVPDVREAKAFVSAMTVAPDRAWLPAELLAFVFDAKPKSRAGEKYFYSDMNYVIAGVVFEQAVGRPLFGEIDRRILKPLGLDQTSPLERRDWRDVVPGFLDRRNPFFVAAGPAGETMRDGRFVYNVTAEYAGGGLVSTARDLARWAKALWEGRVFSAARLADMLAGQPSEGQSRYGLAVGISQSGVGPVYGHDGLMPGYQTVLVYFADLKLAAAMQVNSDPMSRYKLAPGDVLGEVVSIAIRKLRGKGPSWSSEARR